MLKGSCCCGAIQFEILAQPTMMGTCHCSRCRKVGASTLIFVNAKDCHLMQGEAAIKVYQAQAPFIYPRAFCQHCGTALGGIATGAESFPIPVNCLDDEPGLNNQFHLFVASKPDWYAICDQAPQFAETPPAGSEQPAS